MAHTQVSYVPELSVGARPDVSAVWCGYNPSQYKFDAFMHGIYMDICLGEITRAKETLPPGHAFLLDTLDPEAILGDGFRHIEFGRSFIKDYEEVKKPGVNLAPVSAAPVNIIVEVDRTEEKWETACSYNLHDFPQYFKDYATFTQFMQYLKGSLKWAIQDAISLIIKAIIGSNPTKVVLDDKDFARIFGKTKLDPRVSQEALSEEAKAYNALMREKIKKYNGKACELWKNIQFYNPYWFSYTNEFEEDRRDAFYEEAKPGQDKAKKLSQEIYTAAHGEDESEVTKHIGNLHRNDCLFAMFDAISKATNIMFTERTAEFCLGNDTALTIYNTKAAKDRAQKAGHGVDGRALQGGRDGSIVDTATASKNDEGFEAITEPQYLGIYLNPEDYIDLKNGVSRRGPMDTRSVKLADLGDLNIFADRVIPPGFIRMFDKRALIIRPYYEHSDVALPKEKLHIRYKAFWLMVIAMFKNFVGTLFLPSPHFVAAPRYYNLHGIVGQELEKKKG